MPVQIFNFSFRQKSLIGFINFCKHDIISFTVGHMEGRAQRITHGMNGCTSGISKGNSRISTCKQQVARKNFMDGAALGCDFFISIQNYLHSLQRKHFCKAVCLRRCIGFNGMNQRIDGAGRKHLKRQSVQQFRNQDGFIRIKLRYGQTHFRMNRCQLKNRYIRHFTACSAGRRHKNQCFIPDWFNFMFI